MIMGTHDLSTSQAQVPAHMSRTERIYQYASDMDQYLKIDTITISVNSTIVGPISNQET